MWHITNIPRVFVRAFFLLLREIWNQFNPILPFLIVDLRCFSGSAKGPMRWSAKKQWSRAKSTCAPTRVPETPTPLSSWSSKDLSRPPSLGGSQPGTPPNGVWVFWFSNRESACTLMSKKTHADKHFFLLGRKDLRGVEEGAGKCSITYSCYNCM